MDRKLLGLKLCIAASIGFLAAALASLLVPASAIRNNFAENPPKYGCGSPLSFITGGSERGWKIVDSRRVPTTLPGQIVAEETEPDEFKTKVCKEAMAPRLGFTTFSLGIGLVTVLLLLVFVIKPTKSTLLD